jgi:hypothetical protein
MKNQHKLILAPHARSLAGDLGDHAGSSRILSYYGKDRLVHVCGPAGFGFAEDPFGYHMGTVAKDRPRLMLDVEFGISPSRIRHLSN